jgi:hypothetical protein
VPILIAVAGVCSCNHEDYHRIFPLKLPIETRVVAGANSCKGNPFGGENAIQRHLTGIHG